ncbi:methyl-accepting chemotaxis protein [Piscinibacter terrae]|nr:methyl-accepting chemotaxis protein [Albitalea terrae]
MNRPALTLGHRFGLGFSLILALLVAITAVSQVLMSAMGQQMKAIVEVNERQMHLASQMIDKVNEMGLHLRTLTLLTDIKEVDRHMQLLQRTTAGVLAIERELQDALAADGAPQEFSTLITRISQQRQSVLPLIARAARLGADGATPEATTVLMKEVRPIEEQWRQAVADLIELEQHRSAQAYAQAKSRQQVASVVLVIACALSIGLGAFLAWRLTRSVLVPVNQAIEATERIAAGNLAQPVLPTRRDELGRLLLAVGRMQAQLQGLVGAIHESATSISVASSQIATGNQDLSHRTERQAASLQKTASSMAALTTTVRHNASAVHQADQMAVLASQTAARGGAVVDQVVTTMAEISASSRQIEEITGVIDAIAFQTNILALNAAVEAARAGEQGRGFAVVAGEVRGLAGRSADAARQIKSLIHTSAQRVASGATLVADAGSTMREVVASVHRVTAIMSEISASTSQQSDGIEQVSGEVGQLDRMTQQNAALVEQSAAATESLKAQAMQLQGTVGVFTLGSDEPVTAQCA